MSSTTAMDSARTKSGSGTPSASPSGETATSPRAIAKAIFIEPDVSRQRELFAQCPEHLRKLVTSHVKIWRALDDTEIK